MRRQADARIRPVLATSQISTSPSKTPGKPAPQSGGLPTLFHKFDVRDRKDASAKRRFRVNLPKPMLVVLTVIFLIVPMLIFFYKEVHMGHNEAHYKSEKFINVDTHDVMSHFFGDDYDIQNQTKVLPAEPAVSSSDKQVLIEENLQKTVPASNLTASHDEVIDEVAPKGNLTASVDAVIDEALPAANLTASVDGMIDQTVPAANLTGGINGVTVDVLEGGGKRQRHLRRHLIA